MNTRECGRGGEDAAAKYLIAHGFEILAKNYSMKTNFQGGEIDIIAKKGARIHFVEVKVRNTNTFGTGRDAVGQHKQRTIRALAARWLQSKKLYDKIDSCFDVAEIKDSVVDYFENVF
jgi:putative endonuclease